jgi:hypothetical protein
VPERNVGNNRAKGEIGRDQVEGVRGGEERGADFIVLGLVELAVYVRS